MTIVQPVMTYKNIHYPWIYYNFIRVIGVIVQYIKATKLIRLANLLKLQNYSIIELLSIQLV